MNQPVLILDKVTKTYPGDIRALNGISFSVQRSEVVVIVGPSGCGKSTLLRTINGLEPIRSGSIIFDEQPITDGKADWESIRERIGMVFQSYELFPHLSVLDNLLLGPKIVQKRDRSDAEKQAHALLARVNLDDRSDAYPRQLSGGQKQRIAIVRALMMQPEVLLLDEITASLDPEIVREVLDVVMELASDGMTMLIVTHEMAFARAIADRVIFLEAGQIIEQGDPEAFFTAPQTERAQQFLTTFSFDSPSAQNRERHEQRPAQ